MTITICQREIERMILDHLRALVPPPPGPTKQTRVVRFLVVGTTATAITAEVEIQTEE